ncbi:MAG: family 16 glycosylhydrolase [Oscillospiraceae bacterium]|nr:family 16 glycosylhydrolase [Oscillospiraceae bacterium]
MADRFRAFYEWAFTPRQYDALVSAWGHFKALFSAGNITRIGVILVALFQALGAAVFDSPRTPMGPPLDLSGYEVVFEDEFNGASLDLAKWEYRGTGDRGGAFIHPDQVRVEGGKLILKAEYLAGGAFGAGWYSGMIRTKDEFTRGYFEMTCVCSREGNFSSSWWLNSTGMSSAELSDGGRGGAEIDIFEAFNHKLIKPWQDSVSLAVHVGGYGDGLRSKGLGSYYGKNIYTEYNTFGVLWTEEEYIFYVNGVEAVRTSFEKGVSAAPEYAIISLEPPDEVTAKQDVTAEFIIENVRIYQLAAPSP